MPGCSVKLYAHNIVGVHFKFGKLYIFPPQHPALLRNGLASIATASANHCSAMVRTTAEMVRTNHTLMLAAEVGILHYLVTVEPLSNDHPHQRPSLLYDHISYDGQCFLFVQSLTDDHPRPATGSDGIFSLADDHIAYSRTTVEWMSDRGHHIVHIIPIGGSTQTNTKSLRIACKSGWWRVPLILLTVNDRTSKAERKHNISTSEERIEWQTECGEGKVINFGVGKMQIQEVAKGGNETKVTTASDDVFWILFFLETRQRRLREYGRAWRHCSGLVAALPAVCNGYQYTPIYSHFERGRYCYALPYVCVFRSAHVI